jgi:hypothetical protein
MIVSMRHALRHVLAILLFAGLTIVWLWPVLSSPDSVVPGNGAGDNFTFVWNGWWMRQALATHVSPFHTPMMFAPWGVDLALNTHTALPAAIAALLSTRMSILAATNYVVALHLFLNFVIAYALAWRLTRHSGAAILGGLVFGWSPYVGAHLAGHFNLIAAWTLPLVTLLLLDTLDTGSWRRALILGLALGGTVFIEYYYVFYAAVIVVTLTLARSTAGVPRPGSRRRWQRVLLRTFAVLSIFLLAGIAAVMLTGGTVLSVGTTRISIRGTDNFVAALGLIALAAAIVGWLPAWRVRIDWQTLRADVRLLAVSIVTAALVASPVLVPLFRVWQRGDYVTQKYFWRSAPPGIDMATLLLGNPRGLVWSGYPDRAYAALHVDRVEQIGWLGPGLIALCAIVMLRRTGDPRLRIWTALASVFFVWAAGPFLAAFGHSLHVLLPATLVRFIPAMNNVRIPARAMVVVYLAAAMLVAHAIALLSEHRRTTLAALLALLIIVDYVPAPAEVFHVDRPAVYETLRRQRGSGGVCELPLGLRDGFGERGPADSRTLFYQTIHERPITGGAVSRLPRRIFTGYESDPVLGPLLRLSEGQALGEQRVLDATAASEALLANGMRFIVLNLQTSPPDLVDYVHKGLQLKFLDADAGHQLYEIVVPASGG